MSVGNSPIQTLKSVQWDKYRTSTLYGEVASGAVFVITAIALIAILATASQAAAVSYTPAYAVLGSVGSAALISLVVCRYLHHRGTQKMIINLKNEATKEQIRQQNLANSAQNQAPISVDTTLEENPAEYVRQVIVRPLFREFQNLISAAVTADCVTTTKDLEGKDEEVKQAFAQMQAVFEKLLDNPELYVNTLLINCAGGRKKESVAIRRLLTGYNSKHVNSEKYQVLEKEYGTLMRARNFTDVADLFKSSQSNEQILNALPQFLATNHFALIDDTLQDLGKNVLHHIFGRVGQNAKVMSKLTELRTKAAHTNDLMKETKEFLKLVFQEAKASEDTLNQWNKDLAEHMLKNQFTRTMRRFLSFLALNSDLIELMFDKQAEKDIVFHKLAMTALQSENCDCIFDQGLQTDLFDAQSTINLHRKPELCIGLVALDPSEQRNYETLVNQEPIFKHCFAAHKNHNFQELKKFENQPEIKALSSKHGRRIVALPISISEHPFKKAKEWETVIQKGTGAANAILGAFGVKDWVIRQALNWLVKPSLNQMLPALDEGDQKLLDQAIDTLGKLLADPIIDGAILKTEFYEHFERIMSTAGSDFATNLKELAAEPEITFEKIRDVCTDSVRPVTEEFNKVVGG